MATPCHWYVICQAAISRTVVATPGNPNCFPLYLSHISLYEHHGWSWWPWPLPLLIQLWVLFPHVNSHFLIYLPLAGKPNCFPLYLSHISLCEHHGWCWWPWPLPLLIQLWVLFPHVNSHFLIHLPLGQTLEHLLILLQSVSHQVIYLYCLGLIFLHMQVSCTVVTYWLYCE
jgi:hypothetical protein